LLDAPDNLLDARLGARTDDTLFFHGDIDDVRIYNRLLTADEVGLLAVPVPSSLALAALSAIALLIARRRR
jgi:hypothetical protein